MWNTPEGVRVLSEPEWALFVTGLALLRDAVEEDLRDDADNSGTGVAVFDRLTAEQKLALLSEVAVALRDPALDPPAHTAVNEGAIAAVLEMVRAALELELYGAETDGGRAKKATRRMLIAACSGPGRDAGPPPRRARA